MAAEFIPTQGFLNCPKCNGWQVIDKTPRKPNGWPLGGFNYVDCDNCFGKGEVRAPDGVKSWPEAPEPAWQIPRPKPLVEAPACPHLNQVEVWGKVKCNDCNKFL